MPFHARLLLQSLPEFCTAIEAAEGIKQQSPPVQGAPPMAEPAMELPTTTKETPDAKEDVPW